VSYQLRDNSTNINDPVSGTGGMIKLPTGNLTATAAFNVLATNAVWSCSAQLTATATITVNPYVANNKFGVHAVSGSRIGFIDFLQRCAAAGKPVAVVKCVDDFGAASDARDFSPQTLTIGRLNTIDGYDLQGLDYLINAGTTPQEGAAWYYSHVKAKWEQNRHRIDVWETCNEWSWHYAWQADFYIAMMDLAEADGFRTGLWMASGGNPPVQFYPEIARSCARAKAHGNHILCLHEYSWDGLLMDAPSSLVTRYRQLYTSLASQNAVIPLAITEAGQNGGGGFVGTSAFVEDYAWYDSQMRQDDYVIGCAAWTLGDWGGTGVNFQEALPTMGDHIIAH
jgi:hypothetical protein